MEPILKANHLLVERNQKKVLQVDEVLIDKGELLSVIGPNGAGKSTLLMALSTILPISGGDIYFENTRIDDRNKLAYRRQIGMVLQDPLLLDTSVSENIGTGMRFRGIKESIIKKSVAHWAEQLNIAHLLKRKSRQLSGGEAQRVSLARALVLEPKILFLDEPFSALDAPTRSKLIKDFQNLQKEHHFTTLFVTHDLDEAMILADRVAIVMGGGIRQVDSPQIVFSSPSDREVASFVGVETIIPGVVIATRDELVSVKVNGFTVEVVGEAPVNSQVFVCMRPEDVTLWKDTHLSQTSARNHLFGQIKEITPQGPLERVVIDCGFTLVAFITRTSAKEMQLEVQQTIYASFKASTAHLILR